MNKELIRMQFLSGIITESEYNAKLNESPSSKIYYFTFNNGDYKYETISSLPSNIIGYNMGGGGMPEEEGYVHIDTMSPDEFGEEAVDYGLNEEYNEVYYIQHNLNNYISLPKVPNIITSKITHYISNQENFTKTINDALSPKGKVIFYADLIDFEMEDEDISGKNDLNFFKLMTKKYGFKILDSMGKEISIDEVPQYEEERIYLKKHKSPISPPEIMKYEIENTETGEKGFIQYEKINKYPIETVSDNFQDDFYKNGKPIEWNGFPEDDKGPFLWTHVNPKRGKYKLIRRIK
jgi:hypothetical protein